jgi:hypothetical protein
MSREGCVLRIRGIDCAGAVVDCEEARPYRESEEKERRITGKEQSI